MVRRTTYLIEKHDPRALQQRSRGDDNALQLSATQCADRVVCHVQQTEALEHVLHKRLALSLGNVLVGIQANSIIQCLGHRQMHGQLVHLLHIPVVHGYNGQECSAGVLYVPGNT